MCPQCRVESGEQIRITVWTVENTGHTLQHAGTVKSVEKSRAEPDLLESVDVTFSTIGTTVCVFLRYIIIHLASVREVIPSGFA